MTRRQAARPCNHGRHRESAATMWRWKSIPIQQPVGSAEHNCESGRLSQQCMITRRDPKFSTVLVVSNREEALNGGMGKFLFCARNRAMLCLDRVFGLVCSENLSSQGGRNKPVVALFAVLALALRSQSERPAAKWKGLHVARVRDGTYPSAHHDWSHRHRQDTPRLITLDIPLVVLYPTCLFPHHQL